MLNENINTFLPRAIDTADQMRAAPPGPPGGNGQQCAADHGKNTPCCGQKHDPGTTVAEKFQCPKTAPICVGYVYDEHYGHCTGTAPGPPPPPGTNVTKDQYIYVSSKLRGG